ncbi:MAG: hypothetical protein US62_C0026G0004 [Candidatus Woesebacteria bacterium GW2011_GWA1_37_8]|uniref:Uncharacterized protein n=2 Tax=Candidatus Woeseibacteriota TaxID=1752722 RepID=A0A0G0PDT3_9BACT|nr:MAG: hypothetical protein US62_C0026G0004 [Candidatus Woesebacteria bacterium GW2011_GWA1_37_8]KKQ87446.1 MAG: hypothetical protein UT10_C0006G0004 [Candidatus Woesebacteria bacterium GW2011_GWB1_38_8b]
MTLLIPDSEYDIPPSPFRDKPKAKEAKTSWLTPKKAIFYISGSLFVALTLFIYTNFGSNKLKGNSSLTKTDTQKIIKEVASKIDIPDETPTIITVVDLEKIKKYQFFNKADIGDLVLIFPNNKKAILYRPRDSKIIEVGKVQDEGSVAGEKTSAVSPSPVSSVLTPSVTLQPTSAATASPSLLKQ